MKFAKEVVPFLGAGIVVALLIVVICKFACGLSWEISAISGGLTGLVLNGYFLYFFRDPDRDPPVDPSIVLSGADGTVALITEMREDKHMCCEVYRISIFLSLFSVHVNRMPISGKSNFLGYFPGKRLFTFDEKSSEVNQHNKIFIEGEKIKCLVTQIVGPVCRRVVYWPDHNNPVDVKAGDKLGMMKFGSRMDIYLPKDDVDVAVKIGDKVAAGLSVIARLKG